MKRIAILGSTGSIGVSALKVIAQYPSKFKVTALTCDSNFELLARQAAKHKPEMLGIRDAAKIKELKSRLAAGSGTRIFGGPEGLEEIAKNSRADLVIVAISGNASLMPLVRAIESKKDIALASKEPLVSAGEIVTKLAAKKRVSIIPVDSEHSAIFQCLRGANVQELKRVYLTGTGGPLRSIKKSLFDSLPTKRVLTHPKWKMGKKISVDSATLMNKGLEVIEAKWLFGISHDIIKVIMHPEAIIHSMVEFIDGSLLAQLAVPDMRLPIQYALNFPERLHTDSYNVDFTRLNKLSFYKPDTKKFPCLSLAYEACRIGGSCPAALNAANEEAVGQYLNKKIRLTAIPMIIEKVLERHNVIQKPVLNDILSVDRWARDEAKRLINDRCKPPRDWSNT